MKLIRYIHPIGQGAFYTEQFFDDNNQKIATVVYDCGSSSNKTGLEREIYGSFKEDDRIDILFISHFHADHINGIEALCKRAHVKNVLIPFYNKEERLALLATTITKNNNINNDGLKRLIIDPKTYFSDIGDKEKKTRVIEVIPNSTSANKSYILDDSEFNEKEIGSGSKVSLPNLTWEYIPYNSENNERFQTFLSKCNRLGISLNYIEQEIQNEQYRKSLRKAYEATIPKCAINKYSMMVYSGASNEKLNYGACLYTGDMSLNQIEISNISCLLNVRCCNLSMFQIPHHASLDSFDTSVFRILDQTPFPLLFASCGNKNKYGHPSPFVITQCNLFLSEKTRRQTKDKQGVSLMTEQRVKIVCEDKNSMLVMIFDFNNNN